MKGFITYLLELLAGRRLKRFKGDVVVVAGSVGKTSTTNAIAVLLAQSRRVLSTDGFNTEIGVPLVILELDLPKKLRSPMAWLKQLWKGWRQSKKPLPYDVLVLELGIDQLGDMRRFKRYIRANLAVLTALTAEHLLYMGSLELAQREEKRVAEFSDHVLVNADMIDQKLVEDIPKDKVSFYGGDSKFAVIESKFNLASGFGLKLRIDGDEVATTFHLLGKHNLQVATAAAAVGHTLGMTTKNITAGIAKLRALPGRMHLLPGNEDRSWIIDDTYNSVGVESAMAALNTLYDLDTPHRYAILGSMNEIGSGSAEAHRQVGELCDPKKLDLLVTIGKDAKEFLAPAAIKKGCTVKSVLKPIEAGELIASLWLPGTIVLVKGSQNGVFAEEAVKILLGSPKDVDQLVRQTSAWLERKRAQGIVS